MRFYSQNTSFYEKIFINIKYIINRRDNPPGFNTFVRLHHTLFELKLIPSFNGHKSRAENKEISQKNLERLNLLIAYSETNKDNLKTPNMISYSELEISSIFIKLYVIFSHSL